MHLNPDTRRLASPGKAPRAEENVKRGPGDRLFRSGLFFLASIYLGLIAACLVADLTFTTPGHLIESLKSREILYSIQLSLITCTLSAIFSLLVAVPMGYLLARTNLPLKSWVNVLLDVPIMLPPLVIGLSLLILFQTPPGKWVDEVMEDLFGTTFTYAVPGVILAQFLVAGAFAVRTMEVSFRQLHPRTEQVGLTLGCSQAQAFFKVVLPQVRGGMLSAFAIAWSRSLGEFGPILVFAGATRMRTEVLSTTVFLELTVGNIEAAVAVSLIMIVTAIGALLTIRLFDVENRR